MKAVRLHARGGPELLAYEDAPRPEPGDGEVLVQVHATAVTPTEFQWAPTWTTRSGEARPFPLILGHEFSGVVAEVGRGVTAPARGEAVYGLNDWFHDGAQAEYCVAQADEVAAKPRSVDHVQAAAVPISALTAWQGLFDHASPCSRHWRLISSAHQCSLGRQFGPLSPPTTPGPCVRCTRRPGTARHRPACC
jgi:NADPH:quinone reductase-like Zn-dependent oxidoreductase